MEPFNFNHIVWIKDSHYSFPMGATLEALKKDLSINDFEQIADGIFYSQFEHQINKQKGYATVFFVNVEGVIKESIYMQYDKR